jgi:hypothetical protein
MVSLTEFSTFFEQFEMMNTINIHPVSFIRQLSFFIGISNEMEYWHDGGKDN